MIHLRQDGLLNPDLRTTATTIKDPSSGPRSPRPVAHRSVACAYGTVDLRLLEYFIAVAEGLHFSRATERLHIAQPSLSQQIRRLEAQLGVSLLERNSRNVHLTPAGQALLEEGRKTLSQAQHAIQTARSAGAPRLTVGFYGSAASELLPDVLRAFSERLPAVDVTVRELLLGSIDDILDGSVNIAFTRLLPGQLSSKSRF